MPPVRPYGRRSKARVLIGANPRSKFQTHFGATDCAQPFAKPRQDRSWIVTARLLLVSFFSGIVEHRSAVYAREAARQFCAHACLPICGDALCSAIALTQRAARSRPGAL